MRIAAGDPDLLLGERDDCLVIQHNSPKTIVLARLDEQCIPVPKWGVYGYDFAQLMKYGQL